MSDETKAKIKAIVIRVLRTMGQVAAGYITVGAALQEIDWLRMLSVVAVAGIYSLITNLISAPPEGSVDGEVIIDPKGESLGNLTIFTRQNAFVNKKQIVLQVKEGELSNSEDTTDGKDE